MKMKLTISRDGNGHPVCIERDFRSVCAMNYVLRDAKSVVYNSDPTLTEAIADAKLFCDSVNELKTLLAERDELRAALESLLPLAVHTSPDDVAVHAARAALVKTKEAK